MIKILMLNYEFPPLGGGAGNATKYILKEFSKYDNIQVDLVTSSTDKFNIEQFSDNITIHYLDINKDPSKLHSQCDKDLLIYSAKAYSYCKKLKKTNNFDLIHSFFGIPCGYIAKKLKIPYIVSLRGSDVSHYNKKYELYDKLIFKRLSKKIWKKSCSVIANSKGLKELALLTAPEQDIRIIYNGIDSTEFEAKKEYSKTGKIKILCVGRLIPRKGFRFVIEAVKELKDNVSITFIGDGPLKEELTKLSEGLDVEFKGVVEHDILGSLYKNYDLFILPSFNEGMSNTVLEALSAGLPIIATDTGGTAELIDGNGYIVKSGSSDEIKKRLELYIKHRELLEKQGKRSRELAEEMTWESVAEGYMKEYGKIAGEKLVERKKRILMITTTPMYSEKGSSLRVYSNLKILSNEYDIDLVTYSSGMKFTMENVKIYRTSKYFKPNLKISKITFSKIILDFFILMKVRKLLKINKYDIIHCEDFEALMVCKYLSLDKKHYVVYDLHNKPSLNLRITNSKYRTIKFAENLERKNIKIANLIILNWDMYKNDPLFKNKNTFLKYDELDMSFEKIKLPECKYIIYTGNFLSYQGVEDFLKTFAIINTDVKLMLVGDTNREIKELISKLNINKKIIFMGRLSVQKTNYLIDNSLFAIIPRNKGIQPSMKTIHYLVREKPILARDIICNRELIEDNKNALLYKKENDLINKLDELIKNKNNIIEKLSSGAKETKKLIIDNWDKEKFLRRYKDEK